jgi:hypothetical protein
MGENILRFLWNIYTDTVALADPLVSEIIAQLARFVVEIVEGVFDRLAIRVFEDHR